MVRWFAKATRALRRRESIEPQPFDLGCACGNRISGVRKSAFQAVACNRCGNFLFVLPADVYPRPKPKKKKKPPAESPLTSRIERESIVRGTVKSKSAAQAGAEKTAALANAVAEAPAAGRPLGQSLAESTQAAAVRAKAVFSPFRLIVAAILLVIAATGYFVWQSRLKERAAGSLQAHLDAGGSALAAGDLPKAAGEFGQAARAVDQLGRSDAESVVIRQRAKELHAIVGLTNESLYEMCEQAARESSISPDRWKETFNRLYRKTWLVIEGDVVQEAGPDGSVHAWIKYPLPVDGAPVLLDAGLPAIEALPASDRPRHVIFGAQLASFEKEGKKSPAWILRVVPNSAFVWTNFDTFRALGFELKEGSEQDTARAAIQAQADSLGVKPE